jgi:uncharacterized membrane protein HdeD (DUF308 family)
MEQTRTRLIVAASALIAIQVIHGAIPAETDAEGYVGLVAGLVALIAGITALVGLVRGRSWARPLLGINGLSVAIGFLLYHALPIDSPATNPYFGEDKIGLAQWTPVILCIAIGLWAAWEAFVRAEADEPALSA